MLKITSQMEKFNLDQFKIKNNDQKCSLWFHVRHINPAKIHPERITWKDKKLVNSLNFDGIEFPALEKGFSKIEKKNNICINVLL